MRAYTAPAAAATAASTTSSLQQQQQQQQPALQAVQHVCRLLRGYGITHLTPELLRQAKFDAPQSCGPLLLALHDLVLVVSAGLPSGCAAALQRLKQQLQRECVEQDAASGTLTEQGRLLLLHCLSAWGCPHGLVAQLALHTPSSKSALLALAWLIGHAQLFEAALQQLQLPAEGLLPLLPPYPEDSCLTPVAQQRRTAALSAAQRHSERVRQLVRSEQAAAGPGGRAGSSWAAVHTAAQQVLATYRAASLRLQQLTALQEGREKLLHQIQQCQAGSGCPALSVFELHLLAHPQLLQQHQTALQQACDALQQQQQCLQHAQTFFAWASSAVGGVQQQGVAAAAGVTASPPRPTAAVPGPAVADVLPLVQQLPAADSQLAGSVLGKVAQQLKQAAAAAGMPVPPQLVAGDASNGTGLGAAHSLQQGLAGLSLQSVAPRCQHSSAADAGAVAGYAHTAAAAMVQAGVVVDATCAELEGLPDDIQRALQLQARAKQQQAGLLDSRGSATWQRLLVPGPQQQQRDRKQLAALQAAGGGRGECQPGTQAAVPVSDELQRLAEHALHIAKLLAKSRAANKRHLAAAAEALVTAPPQDSGEQAPELVLFQA